ncbi:MAG: VacJ family lipoprotein [Rhodospirillales bacterium]|nr:VacJ family lipoprotein [Rhodospirillales bacterium]
MKRYSLVPRLASGLTGAAFAAAVAGCAGTAAPPPDGGESGRSAATADEAPVSRLIPVDDPLEGVNRRIYKFNAQADRYVLLPIVDAYQFVVPLVLRDRISDFFSNIGNLVTFANQILQLDFPDAGKTALRFGTNTMLGLFGFVDVASAMGMPKYQEDFGQTLGYWGLDGGPYIVLPILGPSNTRDTVGTATDTAAFAIVDPFGLSSLQSRYPPIVAADAINSRYVQSFRYFESGSPFEYELVRYLYTKKREVEIGDVPAERAATADARPFPTGEGTSVGRQPPPVP